MSDRPSYERLTASMAQHSFSDGISDRELSLANTECSAYFDLETRMHRKIIRVFSAGSFPERVTVHEKWPVDWWQAVRERWMPKWWLRRHPVKYQTIDIDRTIYTRICPHIKVPDNRPHVEFLFKKGDHAE